MKPRIEVIDPLKVLKDWRPLRIKVCEACSRINFTDEKCQHNDSPKGKP